MNLYRGLQQRAAAGKPVRVGLIGVGKFGTMFLAQAWWTEGIQVVGVADLEVQRASDALGRAGWPKDRMTLARTSGEINDVAAVGYIGLIEDARKLIAAELDVVIECTGDPDAGVQHALWAIEAGRHVIMVTVEADVVVGPWLCRRAERAGVVYSLAYGDQPALVCELVDWARTCGFQIVAAGKGTKFLPEYPFSTPETACAYYGVSYEQATQGDFNLKMLNSFVDGTKSAIEMAAIANATGLSPQPSGLGFPPVGVDHLAEVLKPKEDGGILTHSGTVEVVSCLNRDGSPVVGDLRWGVYITFKAPTEYVKQCFRDYGVRTDSSGQYAALYRPNHFIGLELGISVASVALRDEPTGSSQAFVADVTATAKRDLRVGEILEGEAGYAVFGQLMPAQDTLSRRTLPIGLATGAKVVRPVAKAQPLSYTDVELDPNRLLVKLRREMEHEIVASGRIPFGDGSIDNLRQVSRGPLLPAVSAKRRQS